ncbi:MAG: hypothetical protein RQ899_12465 [Pseudomonadales bacterium]|nr:hypothetical protein [Pseudomonadales bacterium]
MLYALPDHLVMEEVLPGLCDCHLSVDDALARIQRTPGLVPVAIDPSGAGRLYLADIGAAPLLEWKHIYTIQRLARDRAIGDVFTTDLAILERDDLDVGGIMPQGLIFHVSRCGSTLLVKGLARSPDNLTINQGGPLQEGFWSYITRQWQQWPACSERNLRMLRNLVLLMTRKRRPEYTRSFIKFISWNVIYIDFIRAAFPAAATLYLYRDPVEVIATVMQETTAVLRSKGLLQARALTGLAPECTRQMSEIEYLAHCYSHYFDVVLGMADAPGLHLLNYRELKQPENLQAILDRSLDLRPDTAELEQMQQQYRYFSKDDSGQKLFAGDPSAMLDTLSGHERQLIDKICGPGMARLDASRQNLFPSA